LIVLAFFAAVTARPFLTKAISTWISSSDLENRQESFSGSSEKLINSIIHPTLDCPVQHGKNNIWCSSFQLAWNEMKNNVIKEPVLVKDAQDVCLRLNSAKQDKTDLLPESYYAAAGFISDGIIQKIHTDMSSRFPSKKIPEFDVSGNNLIAYAYFETYIKFTTPFLQCTSPLIFNDSSGKQTPVKSFGTWDSFSTLRELLCEQVEVLYCKIENNSMTEFALDLCKQTEPYQIVMAVMKSQNSLESSYNQLQAKIESFKSQEDYNTLAGLQSEDELQIPDMFWKIDHSFNELVGKSLMNMNAQGMPITVAVQMIHFRLDRAGVTLKSEAYLEKAASQMLFPRKFIFDKPFLLYLKMRDAQQPFFVMWVDNAELLTPFGSK
jgi:hypothetical protein